MDSPHTVTFARARWRNFLYPDFLHHLHFEFKRRRKNHLQFERNNKKRQQRHLLEANISKDEAHFGSIFGGNVPWTTTTGVLCMLRRKSVIFCSGFVLEIYREVKSPSRRTQGDSWTLCSKQTSWSRLLQETSSFDWLSDQTGQFYYNPFEI